MDAMSVNPANRSENRKKRSLPKAAEPYRFKPGQSGNPSGRPKSTPITDALRKALSNPQELSRIIAAILQKAKKGDVKAFQAVAERLEGKPAQALTLAGENGGPIVFRLERIGKTEDQA
jgi:hypothetical protein